MYSPSNKVMKRQQQQGRQHQQHQRTIVSLVINIKLIIILISAHSLIFSQLALASYAINQKQQQLRPRITVQEGQQSKPADVLRISSSPSRPNKSFSRPLLINHDQRNYHSHKHHHHHHQQQQQQQQQQHQRQAFARNLHLAGTMIRQQNTGKQQYQLKQANSNQSRANSLQFQSMSRVAAERRNSSPSTTSNVNEHSKHQQQQQQQSSFAEANASKQQQQHSPPGGQNNNQAGEKGRMLICYYTTRQTAPYWPKGAQEFVIPAEKVMHLNTVEPNVSQMARDMQSNQQHSAPFLPSSQPPGNMIQYEPYPSPSEQHQSLSLPSGSKSAHVELEFSSSSAQNIKLQQQQQQQQQQQAYSKPKSSPAPQVLITDADFDSSRPNLVPISLVSPPPLPPQPQQVTLSSSMHHLHRQQQQQQQQPRLTLPGNTVLGNNGDSFGAKSNSNGGKPHQLIMVMANGVVGGNGQTMTNNSPNIVDHTPPNTNRQQQLIFSPAIGEQQALNTNNNDAIDLNDISNNNEHHQLQKQQQQQQQQHLPPVPVSSYRSQPIDKANKGQYFHLNQQQQQQWADNGENKQQQFVVRQSASFNHDANSLNNNNNNNNLAAQSRSKSLQTAESELSPALPFAAGQGSGDLIVIGPEIGPVSAAMSSQLISSSGGGSVAANNNDKDNNNNNNNLYAYRNLNQQQQPSSNVVSSANQQLTAPATASASPSTATTVSTSTTSQAAAANSNQQYPRYASNGSVVRFPGPSSTLASSMPFVALPSIVIATTATAPTTTSSGSAPSSTSGLTLTSTAADSVSTTGNDQHQILGATGSSTTASIPVVVQHHHQGSPPPPPGAIYKLTAAPPSPTIIMSNQARGESSSSSSGSDIQQQQQQQASSTTAPPPQGANQLPTAALVSSPLSTMFDVFGAATHYLMRFKPSSLISPSSFASSFNNLAASSSLLGDHGDHINNHHHHQAIKIQQQQQRQSIQKNNSSTSLLAAISPSSLMSLPFSGGLLAAAVNGATGAKPSTSDRSSTGSGGQGATSGDFLSRLSLQSNQRREDICGRTIQTPERRIIGGEGARYGEFPYQVHIKIAKHQCGGALIDKQSIVTAAHCVYHFITRAPVSKLQIVIGAYDIEDEQYQELPPQYFKVNKVKLHPNFRFSASHPDRYDIAILKLDKPVKYTDNVLPVCLPSKDLKYETMVGTVTGFGKTDPSLSNRYGTRLLQKVDVPIIENNECERWHRTRGIDLKIFPEMMCAGYEDGLKDACVGDSGGPLVVKTASGPNGSFRWTLAGITSAGFGCAQSRQPGIYHRVSHTVDWILENLD